MVSKPLYTSEFKANVDARIRLARPSGSRPNAHASRQPVVASPLTTGQRNEGPNQNTGARGSTAAQPAVGIIGSTAAAAGKGPATSLYPSPEATEAFLRLATGAHSTPSQVSAVHSKGLSGPHSHSHCQAISLLGESYHATYYCACAALRFRHKDVSVKHRTCDMMKQKYLGWPCPANLCSVLELCLIKEEAPVEPGTAPA